MQLFPCGEGWRDWANYSVNPVINAWRRTYVLFTYLLIFNQAHLHFSHLAIYSNVCLDFVLSGAMAYCWHSTT